ncbi:AraC family transcriptional regulator [Terasakiella pusilla]|uniref:AraC family transcriptional regulator n=1 Tax=Terasakiella pusilla TaxID=64973 RepID=UPI003AA7B906
MTAPTHQNWLQLKHDSETGIETQHAHFKGQAYDPHWHETYVIGFTETGVQQFDCRHQTHTSLQGGCFLLEPGDLHDGRAPCEEGFTYRSLYIPKDWLTQQISQLFEARPDHFELTFSRTLSTDKRLAAATSSAFLAKHLGDPKIVQEGCLDHMIHNLTHHMAWRQKRYAPNGHHLAYRIRDYLNDHLETDIVVQDIADEFGYDRFQINRAFKTAFGVTPHLYLVRTRLARARTLLAQGHSANAVAHSLCFSDQSHLGRWFKRAYRLTPAAYQKCCAPQP